MLFSILELPLDASGRTRIRWELHDGPDGAFTESGFAPTIPLALVAVTQARRRPARNFHHNPGTPSSHRPPDPAPTHIQTPHGNSLPAHQDVPPPPHSPSPARLQLSLPGLG